MQYPPVGQDDATLVIAAAVSLTDFSLAVAFSAASQSP